MTKILTAEGWAYMVIVNDWFTKKILGAFVADRSRAADWLEAVNQAVCRQYPNGIRETKHLALNLMSDNGTQPTSLSFMRECRALGIRQAFTAYANPKGNADTERLIRTHQGRNLLAARMVVGQRTGSRDEKVCRIL